MQKSRVHPSISALAEVGILFLPAIPAYIWLWPHIASANKDTAQVFSYLYMLAGALIIGLRRWSLSELGLNTKGWTTSLACGGALVLGRALVTLSVDWPLSGPAVTLLGLAGEIIFYVGLVGVTEELLFRGVVYHALDTWGGVRWAIWGSTLAFGLYHVPSQGLLAGLGTFVNGLILVAIRWRAGGIAGVIIVHGAIDIVAVHMLPTFDIQALGRPAIAHPAYLVIGLALMLAVPLYLWKVHPTVERLHRSL